jgi:hypothetical protein
LIGVENRCVAVGETGSLRNTLICSNLHWHYRLEPILSFHNQVHRRPFWNIFDRTHSLRQLLYVQSTHRPFILQVNVPPLCLNVTDPRVVLRRIPIDPPRTFQAFYTWSVEGAVHGGCCQAELQGPQIHTETSQPTLVGVSRIFWTELDLRAFWLPLQPLILRPRRVSSSES